MNAKWHTEDTLELGPGRTLRRGVRFRATGGPVYTTRDGGSVYMGDRGEYVFLHVVVQGARRWIQGQTDDGGTRMVYIGPRRRSSLTGVTYAPHRIRLVRGPRRKRGA